MLLIFLGVVLVIAGGIHYYLWRRLVHDTTAAGGRWRRAGTIAIIAAGMLMFAAILGTRTLPRGVQAVLAWPGYLWLALMFYLLVVLLVVEVPTLVAKVVLRLRTARSTVDAGIALVDAPPAASDPPGDHELELTRRRLLARGVAVTAGLVAVGTTASGVSTALGPPRIKRVRIPLPRLPRGADGLRIALVADIHLGPLRGYGHTRRIVDLINGLDADVVAVVGDLVDGSVAELGHAASPLRELRSRLGAYFVTGNHEYFSGFEEWVEEVARLGLHPLRNERVELPNGLDLIGVNDVTGGEYGDGPDYDRAIAGRDPNRASVLLVHQPVQAKEAAKRGLDLQLSGHTHGGQIYPFHYVVRMQQPVLSGLATVDGMPVYVTNGAGFWGPPVRVGAPPEITLVQLQTP